MPFLLIGRALVAASFLCALVAYANADDDGTAADAPSAVEPVMVAQTTPRPAETPQANATPSPLPGAATPAPPIGAPPAPAPSVSPLGSAVPGVTPSPSAPTPSPSPMPSLAPFATPKPLLRSSRLSYTAEGYVSAVDQQYRGPGTLPAEAPGFVAGGAIAPGTPYDFWSNAPTVVGVGGHSALIVNGTYAASPAVDVSARFGYGAFDGSVNSAAYWGEEPMPTLDPHLGSRALNATPAFPVHNGQDAANAQRLSVLQGSVALHDGRAALRVGWFDPVQSDRFAFAQPAVTTSLPALAPAMTESIGDGPPQLDLFPVRGSALPLNGADLSVHGGTTTYEAFNASLPAPPQTPARITMLSAVSDDGSGTRLSAQVLHVHTTGDLVTSTTLFGVPPALVPSAQGPLPFTPLGQQQQTIAGVRAAVPLGARADAVAEIGHSWYSTPATPSGITNASGGYYHLGVHRRFGAVDANLDGYRFEPRYATIFLPYGTAENVWSIAYSWPASWLKGTYQLVDNATIGVNRQGVRAKVGTTAGALTARISYAAYNQIDPLNLANGTQAGFVEGYYLPQATLAGGTLGHQKQYAAWIDLKMKGAEAILDFVDDTQHRDATPGNPTEGVSIEYPQYTLTLAHHFSDRLLAAAGLGRYALFGSYSNTGVPNADLAQRAAYAGFEYAFSPGNVLHVQYRAYATSGKPTAAASPSPAYHGGQWLIVQRFRL